MRLKILFGLLLLGIAACQPATDEAPLPTLADLPTLEPSATLEEPSATPTLTVTPSSTPSETPTPTRTPTETRVPTDTPEPSATLQPSATATAGPQQLALTATAQQLERPVFATFTPPPPGVVVVQRPTSTGTPLVVADVVITQGQFQQALDARLAGATSVAGAQVSLQPAGVSVQLTAQTGQAFVTGTILVRFELMGDPSGLNNVLRIQPAAPEAFVMQGGGFPPDAFIEIAYSTLFESVVGAFDDILNARLGEGRHDLEWLRIEGGQMLISLLVPEP